MDKTESRQLTEEIVKILDGRKAKSIEVIHTEKLGAITDYFIICSGTSSTHLRGIADEVLEKLKEKACSARIWKDTIRQIGFYWITSTS